MIWSKEQLEPGLIIAVVTVGFLFYLVLSTSHKLESKFTSNSNNNVSWVIFQRVTGMFFFGIAPLIITIFILKKGIAQFGIHFLNFYTSLLWTLGCIVLIVPMSYFAAKKADNLAIYPQIRKPEWSTGLLILSTITWIMYLAAYEFMFRGFLLFGLAHYFGVLVSITINVAFYSLMHIPKGMKETLGAIPFGIILCLLTIKTGTLWIALCAHISLALSNEWFSLYYQPEMKLVRKT